MHEQIAAAERENGIRHVNDSLTTAVISTVIQGIFGEITTAKTLSHNICKK